MRILGSRDQLIEWAEDEGALDDSIILAVDPSAASLTIGLRMLESAEGDPRDAFRRTKEQFLPFTLSSKGGTVAVQGDLATNASFESSLLEDGDRFGLVLETGEAEVHASGTAWRVDVGAPIAIAVVPELSPADITFHGNGPVTSTLFGDALRAAGVTAQLFGNWSGSGPSMGAALVRDVKTPRPLAEDEELGGAWRVVPGGAEATDPRGVWILGNSSVHSTYARVERTAKSEPALVRAVVEALASLPGLAWASSGNQLVEGAAGRAAWCSST